MCLFHRLQLYRGGGGRGPLGSREGTRGPLSASPPGPRPRGTHHVHVLCGGRRPVRCVAVRWPPWARTPGPKRCEA
eukprot:3915293-Prymnesium_polylepis.1